MSWFRRAPNPAKIAKREAKERAWMAREKAAADHARRLEAAAGIGSVVLVAHSDTWTLILAEAQGYTLWPKTEPPVTAGSDGMVEVQLSGTHVVTLLHSMDMMSHRTSKVDRAIGRRIYSEVARAVDAVDPISGPGQPVPPIVLDARLADPES